MALMTKTVKVTTAGNPGAASGSDRCGIPGGLVRLIALAVDYHASAPGTTDVTITCTQPVTKTLLALTDNNADMPLSQITELERATTGAERAEPCTRSQLVCGDLVVAVAQCNALTDAVVVTAVFEVI